MRCECLIVNVRVGLVYEEGVDYFLFFFCRG